MMDLIQRAHIFSSYDALKGFQELLVQQEKIPAEKRIVSEDEIDELNRRIYEIQKGMMVTVEYQDGNEILHKKGVVSRINIALKQIQIVKTKICLENIIWIEMEEKYIDRSISEVS